MLNPKKTNLLLCCSRKLWQGQPALIAFLGAIAGLLFPFILAAYSDLLPRDPPRAIEFLVILVPFISFWAVAFKAAYKTLIKRDGPSPMDWVFLALFLLVAVVEAVGIVLSALAFRHSLPLYM